MNNSSYSSVLVDDWHLYEPDSVPLDDYDDELDSQGLTLDDLGTEESDSLFLFEPRDSVGEEFDWTEAVPGNIWAPQSLASSSQSSSCDSGLSTMSPGSGKSQRVRVPSDPASLSQASIELALGAECCCRRRPQGVNCMKGFNIGDIYRLRHARHKMSFTETVEKKNHDLQQAWASGDKMGRVAVEGKHICLQAYCMLYNLNWNSARRSWRQLVNGQGRGAMGRPRGSSGGVLSSAKGLQAYAWLKTWIEVNGDQDPVGLKYKYIVNFVLPADLYGEYCADLAVNQICELDLPLSCRAFTRVWAMFKKEEKVRVRRKANTTTKCQGLFEPHSYHVFKNKMDLA